MTCAIRKRETRCFRAARANLIRTQKVYHSVRQNWRASRPLNAAAPPLWPQAVVSEVLSGERPLCAEHIESLASFIRLSPAAFYPLEVTATLPSATTVAVASS